MARASVGTTGGMASGETTRCTSCAVPSRMLCSMDRICRSRGAWWRMSSGKSTIGIPTSARSRSGSNAATIAATSPPIDTPKIPTRVGFWAWTHEMRRRMSHNDWVMPCTLFINSKSRNLLRSLCEERFRRRQGGCPALNVSACVNDSLLGRYTL